jgi:hypothetical protein
MLELGRGKGTKKKGRRSMNAYPNTGPRIRSPAGQTGHGCGYQH